MRFDRRSLERAISDKSKNARNSYLLDDQRRSEVFAALQAEAQIWGIPLADAHRYQRGHLTRFSRELSTKKTTYTILFTSQTLK